MRRRGLTVIWPQYFDSSRSLREGRRIPKELGTIKPTVVDLSVATKRMKLKSEVDQFAKYPRSTWDPPGLLMVNTKGLKKQEFLKKLAPVVQRANEYRLTTAHQQKSKPKKTRMENRKELLKQKIAERKK